MARVPITITVEPVVAEQLKKRAATMGIPPSDYARRLFEAGYAARVGIERGLPATDAELDAAVRAVFPLAGHADARTIAKATGFTRSLVENILRGFRTVAAERKEAAPTRIAEARSEPAGDEAGPDEADDVKPPRGYTAEEFATIRRMYVAGDATRIIAEAVGRSRAALEMMFSKRRDLFPKRSQAGVA